MARIAHYSVNRIAELLSWNLAPAEFAESAQLTARPDEIDVNTVSEFRNCSQPGCCGNRVASLIGPCVLGPDRYVDRLSLGGC